MTTKPPTNLARLAALAGSAKRRSANVRELARFAANSTCPLATAGFATRVDFDHLLQGTHLAAPYGQSPFAFRRGNTFEDLLRRDGHAPLLGLLKDNLHYNIAGAQVANVRQGQPKNKAGLEARAKTTEQLVKSIVTGAKTAPNLIDGAVLGRSIGGAVAYFEADAVAAQFGRPIHVGEIESFPTVDGQADPDKIGAAKGGASIINKAGLLSREHRTVPTILDKVSVVHTKPGKHPGEAILSWPAGPGATSYAIEVNYTPQVAGSTWIALGNGAGRCRVVKAPAPGAQLLARVASVGSDGVASAWSDEVLATAL